METLNHIDETILQIDRRLELLFSLQRQENLPELRSNEPLFNATVNQHYLLTSLVQRQADELLKLGYPELSSSITQRLNLSLPIISSHQTNSSPTTSYGDYSNPTS